jgi:hypothetical protein
VIAHVGGLPVEETIVQLTPAGVGALLFVRLLFGRIRRHAKPRRSAALRDP